MSLIRNLSRTSNWFNIQPDLVGLLAVRATAVSGHPLDGDGERLRVRHGDVARGVRSCHLNAIKQIYLASE